MGVNVLETWMCLDAKGGAPCAVVLVPALNNARSACSLLHCFFLFFALS